MSTILATVGPHGALAPGGTVEAVDGSDVAFTITPSTGYLFDQLLADGEDVSVLPVWNNGVGTFMWEEIPEGDHTLVALFKDDPDYETGTYSIEETLLAAIATRLADPPAGVPELERERYIDLEEGAVGALPALVVLGAQSAPAEGHERDAPNDRRELAVTLGIYARATAELTANQVIDLTVQWVAERLAGPVDHDSPFARLANRINLGTSRLMTGRGGICLRLLELTATYQNLVTDVTKWA